MQQGEGEIPAFTASRKPTSRKARKVFPSAPARVSITLTLICAEFSVSRMRIWSDVSEMSTTSVTGPWKRFSVPRGNSVSKARVRILFAAR